MQKDKKQQAYAVIKQKIISGELAPAADLSEEELIRELGISRTPIREAIQKLSEEGFVSIYPRKGTIVSEITLDTIRWIYEARKLNEPYMTAGACGKLSEDWLLKMRREFEEIHQAADANAREVRQRYVALDREFHEAILDTCPNVFLRNFMKNINDHSHRLRIKTGGANREYKPAVEAHLAIVDALLAGNPAKTEEAAREHIAQAVQTAYQYM